MSNNGYLKCVGVLTKYKKPAVKCQTPLSVGESGYETSVFSAHVTHLTKVATPSIGFVGAVIRFQPRLANRVAESSSE